MLASLGLLVRAPAGVVPRPLGIVETHLRAAVGSRRDVDDAPRVRCAENIEQQAGEQELAQMIEGPGHLDAVRAGDTAMEPGADVVHQHVQTRESGVQTPGEGTNVRLSCQVGKLELDRLIARLRLEGGHPPLALCRIAPDDDHASPVPRERTGGHPADAVRRTGHETDPAAHVTSLPASEPSPAQFRPQSRRLSPRHPPRTGPSYRAFAPCRWW